MSMPRLPDERGLMIDTLQRRQEYLRLMIDSHIRWMRATDDQQVRDIHRALVDLLQEVAGQYVVLLDTLGRPR